MHSHCPLLVVVFFFILRIMKYEKHDEKGKSRIKKKTPAFNFLPKLVIIEIKLQY